MTQIENVVERLDMTKSIRELGETLHLIGDKITKKTFEEIDTAKLAQKIEHAEDISDVIFFFQELERVSFTSLKKNLMRHLDLEKFGKKMEESGDVGLLILFTKQLPRELKLNLLRILPLHSLVQKMNKEMDIWALGTFLKELEGATLPVARKLANKMDMGKVTEKINGESASLWGINTYLETLLKIDHNTWRTLMGKIDLLTLAKKINRGSLAEISRTMYFFSREKDLGRRLLPKIDLDAIARKIDREANILHLTHLLESFSNLNTSIVRKLLEKVDLKPLVSKLEKESSNLRAYLVATLRERHGTKALLDMLEDEPYFEG